MNHFMIPLLRGSSYNEHCRTDCVLAIIYTGYCRWERKYFPSKQILTHFVPPLHILWVISRRCVSTSSQEDISSSWRCTWTDAAPIKKICCSRRRWWRRWIELPFNWKCNRTTKQENGYWRQNSLSSLFLRRFSSHTTPRKYFLS